MGWAVFLEGRDRRPQCLDLALARLQQGAGAEHGPDHVCGAKGAGALLGDQDDRFALPCAVEGAEHGRDLLAPRRPGGIEELEALQVLPEGEEILGSTLELTLREAQSAADLEWDRRHRHNAERRREIEATRKLARFVELAPCDQRAQQIAD